MRNEINPNKLSFSVELRSYTQLQTRKKGPKQDQYAKVKFFPILFFFFNPLFHSSNCIANKGNPFKAVNTLSGLLHSATRRIWESIRVSPLVRLSKDLAKFMSHWGLGPKTKRSIMELLLNCGKKLNFNQYWSPELSPEYFNGILKIPEITLRQFLCMATYFIKTKKEKNT